MPKFKVNSPVFVYNDSHLSLKVQYSIPFKWRCLVLGLASPTFCDVTCLTERHDQFELLNYLKEQFL